MGQRANAQYNQRMEEAEKQGVWGVFYNGEDTVTWCKYCHGLAGSVPDAIFVYSDDGEERTCDECGRTAKVLLASA